MLYLLKHKQTNKENLKTEHIKKEIKFSTMIYFPNTRDNTRSQILVYNTYVISSVLYQQTFFLMHGNSEFTEIIKL